MKIFREKKLDSNSRVFISYSSKDSKIARQIHTELQELGLKPWLSEIDTAPGANYAQVIPKVIEESVAVVVLVTKDSVKSEQVMRELNLSVGKKHLIPVNMSGRPDILKTAGSWEYFLGIIQMFEHIDVKSTAEKIVESIEHTTGKKFRVELDTHKSAIVEQAQEELVDSPVNAPEEVIEAPSIASEAKEDETQVDLEKEKDELSPATGTKRDWKKLAFAGIATFSLLIALAFSLNSEEGPIVDEEPIQQSLKSEGIWVDQDYLDTGRGNYFTVENRETSVSGEFYGLFISKGKRGETKRVYISITLNDQGEFEGVLDDNSPLNGSLLSSSPVNNGRAVITFEGCEQKFTWVKKQELCSFFLLGT